MTTLFRDCHLMTADPARPGLGRIPDGCVLVKDGLIRWVGPEQDLPSDLAGADRVVECAGGWVTPGLVDCHTHVVFGGDRADEFRRRQEGASYEEIARSGGGILSTVAATRAASRDELQDSGMTRLSRLIASGVTSVEIKSGYGLDLETELRMLRVARSLGHLTGVRISTTLLPAHALPPEFSGDREGYIDLITNEILPEAVQNGLADGVDAFCEGIAFSVDECRRVLTRGRELGLMVRLHADQLSDGGGAALAAELGARSADHLEYTSRKSAEAMASVGTAAVLLPGAFYYLGETQPPPVSDFRELGVPMAVATDANPGSSPVLSVLQAMNMASVLFGLTVDEALLGTTRHAAAVLGREGVAGILRPGAWADLAVWDIDDPVDLVYWTGNAPLQALFAGGRRLLPTEDSDPG